MTNPELLTIKNLLPLLLPHYKFPFVNAENTQIKKLQMMKKPCYPGVRQFLGNYYWGKEQSDLGKYAVSEHEVCVSSLTGWENCM